MLGQGTSVNATTGVAENHRYWPFGDEVGSPPLTQRLAFAAMERDTEASHFYDHARHHDFGLGRFVSVDPVTATKAAITKPQAWNRYSYVVNNPLRWIDPTGRVIEYDDSFKKRLKQDAVFRLAFEAWKRTEAGSRQWRGMGKDTNTVYKFSVGSVKAMTGPLKVEEASGMTLPVVTVRSENTSGKLDLGNVAMTINADFITTTHRLLPAHTPSAMARALFEEASHGLAIGSGTMSAQQAWEQEDRLHGASEPEMDRFDAQLGTALASDGEQ